MVTLEFTFAYPSLYNPPFSTLWASFAQFIFGESEKIPRVRVLLLIFKREEDLVQVFKIFHSIKVVEWEKTFLSMKIQTSHFFLKHKAFFPSLQNFSTMNCKITFSPKSHESHLRIEWNMFLHDLERKSHHMKPCSVF